MTESGATQHTADGRGPTEEGPALLRATLLSPGYLRLLLLCALIGIPVALACFAFLTASHEIQHAVWEKLPDALGYERAPWWWPLPALLLAGLILAPVITRMRGHGGHVPVHGLGGPPIGPADLPSVVLAALAALPLGVVLGPEAPLMAIGGGLAVFAVRAMKQQAQGAKTPGRGTNPQAAAAAKAPMLLATAGSTAAISSIFGGPIVAAVLVVESAGLGGAALVVLLLPCLIASATGALVFTGFGDWTGLSIGALSLPKVPPDMTPDAGDFLWGIPLAAVIGFAVAYLRSLGYAVERWLTRRTAPRIVLVSLAVGALLAAYALLTDRSPEEAALSGQTTLGALAAEPHNWSVVSLLLLFLFKGVAWTLCLGAFRGGPIFPSLLLGAAVALACSGLPGFGTTPALALGIAAGGAVVTGLPLSSSVLTVLLIGSDAHDQMPLIVVAVVTALLAAQLVPRRDAAHTGRRAKSSR